MSDLGPGEVRVTAAATRTASPAGAGARGVPLWVQFCQELASGHRPAPSGGVGVRGDPARPSLRSVAEVDARCIGRAVMEAFRAGGLRSASEAHRERRPPPPSSPFPPPPTCRPAERRRSAVQGSPVLPPPPPLRAVVGAPVPHGTDGGAVVAVPSPPLPPPPAPVGTPGAAALFRPTRAPAWGGAAEVVPAPDALGSRRARRVVARRRARRTVFVASGWARNIGVIVLLFAAWQIWGTALEHDDAQQSLRTQFATAVRHASPGGADPAPAQLASNATVARPRPGSVVGRLQIPAIGVDQYVVEGTAPGDLAMGPGHYVGTSLPGQAGNVAIAGHRTTYGAPFDDLDQLQVGDTVVLTSDAGERLTYVVEGPPTSVSPHDVAVLDSVHDNRLTLTTCTPRFSAAQRLVVVALLSAPQSAVASPVVPHRVRPGDGGGEWDLGALPAVVVLVLALVLVGAFSGRLRRVLGRAARVAVLTPVWAGGLFLLFEAVTKVLPSNL